MHQNIQNDYLTEIKGEIDSSIIIVGGFNTLLMSMDRLDRK